MSTTKWYSDPDLVLRELRGERGERTRLPEISGYAELSEVRRGGQGVVYAGQQISTGRRVAIKVLLDGVYAARADRLRFEREIELVASLRHPHIVRVYDSGTTSDGRLYFVMEFIDGSALDEWIADSGLRTAESERSAPDKAADRTSRNAVVRILSLFAEICEAVNYAHQRGVIHRDLKPSNIRIDPDGQPHVLDFGLAKVAGDGTGGSSQLAVSMTGQFMGSLPWASPEQVRGRNSQIDIRSDVYSLGVMMYQVFAGAFPYDVGGHLREVMEQILQVEPASLRRRSQDRKRGQEQSQASRRVYPGGLRAADDSSPTNDGGDKPRRSPEAPDAFLIDDELDTIVLKCLAKEPERRYQSAGEVARDLRRYLTGEPIEAKRDSTWYVLRKTVRRYRVVVAAAGVVAALAIGFAATVTVLYGQAKAARESEAAARIAAELEAENAKAARESESAARVTAEREADKATQVRQFLQNMLASVDPYWAQGRDVSVLRELLDEAARRIGKSAGAAPAAAPEVEAAIRTTLGQTYMGLGLWDEARPHLEAALDLNRRALGEEHPETFVSRVDWSTWLVDRPATEGAERFIADSLESARRILGPEHSATLSLSLNWGYWLHGLGRLADAEEVYRPTLLTLQRIAGPEGDETVRAMNSLATLLQDMGRWEEAVDLIRNVVEIHRRVRGPEHPDTLLALNNLASALDALGRHAEAESIQREVLALDIKILGQRHPRTLVAMGNLSGMLQYLGRLAEAEELCRRTLELRLELFGEESEPAIISLNNLARILQDGGRWVEAEPLMTRVVELSIRVFGPEHLRTLTAQNTLAANWEILGRVEDAEALQRKTLEAQQRTLGPEHPASLTTMNSLAALLRDNARTDEAEALYREILDRAAASLPEDHWYHFIFQGGLGRTLALAGRHAEAERELLGSFAGLEAAKGPDHVRTQNVRGYLFDLYEAWEKPEASLAFEPGCVDTGAAASGSG